MAAQGTAPEGVSLRCDHCGRFVSETLHTPTSYRVDYYSMHTGQAELSSLAADGEERFIFLKLLEPVEIITCADCYQRPAVRRERDRRFRPERATTGQKDESHG